MPILKRDDGIQFAIHAYRELLQPVKMSVLRNEIEMLAQNHGEYVRLFKQPDGKIEAVFSRDPGYLLGEAVWEYFGKPQDLIYCEALPEGHFAIIVVVRGGNVYLDTKIAFASIHDELASLVTGHNQYDIYVYGKVPISETKERGKLTFDKSQVKSFTVLPQSLFKTLPINESLQLQPIEFAVRSQNIAKKSSTLIIGVAIFTILLAWWYYQHNKAPVVVQQTVAVTKIDPYLAYETGLKSPSPTKQINELATVISIVYGVPGWMVTGVTFDGSTYTIQLNSMGGPVEVLERWSSNHNMNMTLSSQGVTLMLHSNLINRPAPDTIYSLQQVVYVIIDKIDQILPQRSVTLGGMTSLPYFKSAALSIGFNNISPEVLTLIGRQLVNLPVKVTATQITVSQGLLSGSISLTAFGN